MSAGSTEVQLVLQHSQRSHDENAVTKRTPETLRRYTTMFPASVSLDTVKNQVNTTAEEVNTMTEQG